ncbi:hypothetical protein [Streptomyces sp. JHA19]|uniref:hypothetical protein n=1 Tax=Streptomyces sp. JHA19 TaxID=1577588 RepID=UPI00351C2DBE
MVNPDLGPDRPDPGREGEGPGLGAGIDGGDGLLQAGPSVRLIYAIREYRGRKDEPKGFGWRDFRDLIVRARIQLGGPTVLVWDNVRLHLAAGMREFIDANAHLCPGPQPDQGRLVAGQGGHWQPRRDRPRPDHPRREARTEDAAVPT